MKLTFKFILFLLVLAGIPDLLHSQNISIDSSNKSIDIKGDQRDAELHLPEVKKRPEFPGGKKAWQDFLGSNINLKLPNVNKAAPGTYKVMVRFIVGSDGKLRGIGADTNKGYGMENEVIRVIKKSPLWNPAETSSGRPVSFTLRTAVTFIVKQNDAALSFK